jgi:hypothetical protein
MRGFFMGGTFVPDAPMEAAEGGGNPWAYPSRRNKAIRKNFRKEFFNPLNICLRHKELRKILFHRSANRPRIGLHT